MKRLFFFTILFCLAVSVSSAQTRKATPKPAAKPVVKPKAIVAPKIAEISAPEWDAIVKALETEDWAQASRLSSVALGKLKADNDQKQLAQLRYFYLYSLAGQAAGGKLSYAQLAKTADGLVGQEFLMPSRQFLSSCNANVNYICPVKDNEKALRVTATNKSGSAIHSFEYVQLADKVDLAENNGRAAFVGGNLQKAEINLYKQNISIMRLVFDRGFVNIVASR